jgi:hypothetical protein
MKQIKTFDSFINEAMAPTPHIPKLEDFKDPKAFEIFNKLVTALKPFGFVAQPPSDTSFKSAINPQYNREGYIMSFLTKSSELSGDYDIAAIKFNSKDKKFIVVVTMEGKQKLGPEGKSFPVSDSTYAQILQTLEPYKKLPFNHPAKEEGGEEIGHEG